MRKITLNIFIFLFIFYFPSFAENDMNLWQLVMNYMGNKIKQKTLNEAYYDFIKCNYLQNAGYIEEALKSCEETVNKFKSLNTYPFETFSEYLNLLYSMGDLKKLNKEINSFFKINKNLTEKDYVNLLNLLNMYISDEKLNKLLDNALKKYPTNKFFLLKKAELCKFNKNFSCVEKYLKKYISLYPKDIAGYYQLGRFYKSIGKDNLAEKYFLKALRINPKYDPALFSIISLYIDNKKYKKLENLLLSYLKKEPNNTLYLEELFNLYMRIGEYLKAKKVVDKIVKLRPNEERFIISKYYIYLKLKKGREILEDVKRHLEKEPENLDLLLILGLIYEQNKQYKKAEKIYKKIIRLDKGFKDAYDRLAQIYYEQGKFKEAEKILKALLNNYFFFSHIEKSKYYIYLSDILKKEGKIEEGLEYLKKALNIDPDNPNINFYIAVYYDDIGNWKKAKEYLEKAIKLNPDFADALNYLGYSLLLRNEEIDKALKLIRRAVYLDSENGAYLDSLGWAYYKKGIYKKALMYLLKAYKKMGDDPVMLYHLGAVYEKLGDKKKALNYYQKALKELKKLGKEPEKGLKEKILEGIKRVQWDEFFFYLYF